MSSIPSTPKPALKREVSTDSPGTWRHPRYNEIIQRQNAATFGERNVRRLVWNGGFLAASWIFSELFYECSSRLQIFLGLEGYPGIPLLVLRLFFLTNIAIALYPLFRKKDDLSDIPLTPTQRALLGLDPKATPPATPGTAYVTPPRYRLSSGSRQPSPFGRSTSPFSSSESPSHRRASGGSPFSPSASPLLQKAFVNGSRESGRRQSFSSSSSLRESSIFRAPATPSPVGGKGSGLSVSNKWRYEQSLNHFASSGSGF